jgi:protein TonB
MCALIAVNGEEAALPTISGGADLDAFVISDFDDLPPHRAAIPVPPIILSDALGPHAGALFWFSLLAAIGLHGGLLVAAMLWGQGGELPWPEIVAVELVEGAGHVPSVTRMTLDLIDTAETAPAARDSDAAPSEDEAALAVADSTAAPEVPPTATRLPLEQRSTTATALPSNARQATAGPDAVAADVSASEANPPSRRFPETMARLRAMLAVNAAMREGDAPAPPEEAPPRLAEPTASAPSRQKSRQSASGASSAERVAMAVYQRRVRARVVSHLPVGNRGSGWVRIGIQLSPAGAVRSASVLRSSGNGAIDRAALASVRRAGPYSRPPAGATSAQLALSFDFKFE